MSVVKEALLYILAAMYLFGYIAFWATVATVPVAICYMICYYVDYM